MTERSKRPVPPAPRGSSAGTPAAKGILELDRFSAETLDRWSELSADLDELQATLYYSVEPERRRLRPELLNALRGVPPTVLGLQDWARIVDYRWTLFPLSAAGSLTGIGGRFNAGIELEGQAFGPWPALYLAADHATAFREKFQLQADQQVQGLSPEELGLTAGKSHTTVALHGQLSRVFHLTAATLGPVASVLSKIKMPARAAQMMKKLRIKPSELRMVSTGKQLCDVVALHNWRVLPIQFGLPAQSQILAELIRAADFEGIAYKSSRSGGMCLALFVNRLASESFIELSGPTPSGAIARLDATTADKLSGWSEVGVQPPRS